MKIFAHFSFHSSQRLVEDIEYVELCHKAAGEDRTSPQLEHLASPASVLTTELQLSGDHQHSQSTVHCTYCTRDTQTPSLVCTLTY